MDITVEDVGRDGHFIVRAVTESGAYWLGRNLHFDADSGRKIVCGDEGFEAGNDTLKKIIEGAIGDGLKVSPYFGQGLTRDLKKPLLWREATRLEPTDWYGCLEPPPQALEEGVLPILENVLRESTQPPLSAKARPWANWSEEQATIKRGNDPTIEFDRSAAAYRFFLSIYDGSVTAKRIEKGMKEKYSVYSVFFCDDIGYVLETYANETSKRPGPHGWHRPHIDQAEFKREIARIANDYLRLSILHLPKLTVFLCRALLDSEIYPLGREIADPATFSAAEPKDARFQHHLRFGILGNWIATIVLLIISAFFAAIGLGVVALCILAWVVYGFISYSRAHSRLRMELSMIASDVQLKMELLHGRLVQIRDEIYSGYYNKPAMLQRLKAVEADGAYVPSILYSVLMVRE